MADQKPYIDCFLFPVREDSIGTYEEVSKKVASIWKEHGAREYAEFTGEGSSVPGTLAFPDLLRAEQGEIIVFGYAVFNTREEREQAHKKVAQDPRMAALVEPLMQSERPIFDSSRMVYGSFKKLFDH